MADKVYTEALDLKLTCEKIKDRYYLYLGHVDLDAIFFAEVSGAVRPKKGAVAEISGVSAQWLKQRLQEQADYTLYCLSVWGDDWTELSPNTQEWVLFDLLYSIDPANEGKLRKRDVQEHGIICEYLGPYWRGKHAKGEDLPGLLSSKDPLPIPLPPEGDVDEGSTI